MAEYQIFKDATADCSRDMLDGLPPVEIITADIGPVIGAHTGPGMLALIYWGNHR